MSSYEAVLEQAGQLSHEDRERLARELIAGLQPPGEDVSAAQWNAAWGAEIERRLQAYERGEVEAAPWRESIQQVRDALDARWEAQP